MSILFDSNIVKLLNKFKYENGGFEMILENEICPLFDFDEEKISTRQPDKMQVILPSIAILCFFEEVVSKYAKLKNVKKVMTIYHDVIAWNFYKLNYNGIEVTFCQSPMGAPLSVNIMEDLFMNGVETVIACGGCGVLEDIKEGEILIPSSAVRDEGTSYHYVKADKEINLDINLINKVVTILDNLDVKYEICKTWSTDASKRETPNKITLRKKQGCKTVEMECSALAACAKFRNKKFIELLYSGDLLVDTFNYNNRNWQFNNTTRERLFNICLEIASLIDKEK